MHLKMNEKMKDNKTKTEVKLEKPLEQLVNELFILMNNKTNEGWGEYEKRRRPLSRSQSAIDRYFEYWRGLSAMEYTVKTYIETHILSTGNCFCEDESRVKGVAKEKRGNK